ncbi:MAG: TIR domain-containing protein [Flavobacteriaceae bacterium]|nr:TIR domain-containing protein [Flavobacteriaceae bacterium]
MHDIFISYAKEDTDQAEQLAQALKAKGFDVWYDIEIPTGTTYDNVIQKALDDTKCVVVLWSEHSIESEWVKVEAGEGKSRDILVPVLIADVEVPLAFRLRQTASMTGWFKGNDDAAFDRLIEDIQLIIQGDTSTDPVEDLVDKEDEKEDKPEEKKKPPPPPQPKPVKRKFGRYALIGSVLVIALLGWWKISSDQKTKDETIEQVKQDAIDQEKIAEAARLEAIRRSNIVLGEKFEGGIIFHIDESKGRGLIMAQGDETPAPIFWLEKVPDEKVKKAKAYNPGLFGGKSNTEQLVKIFGDGNYPAKICSDLEIEGFTDWYLPSQEELDLLYDNKALGNFSHAYYWSSTEISNRDVYYRSFFDGRSYKKLAKQNSYANQNKAKVRAIRQFEFTPDN